MKRMIGLLVLAMAFSVFAQADNWIWDSTQVTSFKADSLKNTKWFPLAKWEDMVLVAMANDTASAGFLASASAGDSVKFIWGVQYGDVVVNSSGQLDTAVRPYRGIVVDTFNLIDTANITSTAAYNKFDSTGYAGLTLKQIDTLMVTGYATQDRAICPEAHAFFRVFLKGLTGNKKGNFVRTRIMIGRRPGVRVR